MRAIFNYDSTGKSYGPFPTTLPYSRTKKRDAVGIIFGILFSLVWIGFCVTFLVLMSRDGQLKTFVVVFMSCFACAGVLPFYFFMKRNMQIDLYIDRSRISYSAKPLFGSLEVMDASVSEYSGIMVNTRYRGKDSDEKFCEVVLVHPDENRRVILAFFAEEFQQRKAAEFFATALQLDIIETDKQGNVVSRVKASQVDQNYAERNRANLVPNEIVLPPVPAGLIITETPDGFIAEMKLDNIWIPGMVLLIGGCALLFTGQIPFSSFVAAAVLAIAFFALNNSSRVLCVTPEFVSEEIKTRFGCLGLNKVAVAQIEEIKPKKSSGTSAPYVGEFIVASDASQIRIYFGKKGEANPYLYARIKKHVLNHQTAIRK